MSAGPGDFVWREVAEMATPPFAGIVKARNAGGCRGRLVLAGASDS